MWTQTDGVAMGSPLGPTLANVFLSFHEKKWLEECPEDFKPLFYRRYVDDAFVVFRESEHVQQFLTYLNSKHRNIEFTFESECDGKIPFLDVNVEKCNGSLSTSIYRKPTFTGLSTKFSSFIPISYKRNLVLTIVTRAFNICSSYVNLHHELQFIKQFLFNNGFNYRFVDTYIGKQLTRSLTPREPTVTVKKSHSLFLDTIHG